MLSYKAVNCAFGTAVLQQQREDAYYSELCGWRTCVGKMLLT